MGSVSHLILIGEHQKINYPINNGGLLIHVEEISTLPDFLELSVEVILVAVL
jgi:hypothetical protein